jgi:amino acid transporter
MKPDEPSAPRLLRALGPWIATAIVVGTVIGSGVFKKPQTVAYHVPDFGVALLVWGLGGVLAILGALAYAEVTVLYPRAGGNYVLLREGYGRLAGFLWGWVDFWMIRGGSLAALATIFAESLHDILRNDAFQEATGLHLGTQPLGFWSQKVVIVVVIVGLALVNVRGVKWGGVLQLLITLVKVFSLLAIMVLPFVAVAAIAPAVSPTAPGSPIGELPATVTLGGILTALLGVLFAYHGWMNLGPVAEEVKNPQRNLPLALFVGVGIVIFLYVGANWAYQHVIPREELAQMKELSPGELEKFQATHGPDAELPDKTVGIGYCRRLLGPIGAVLAAAAVMFSVFGALNGNLLVGPRLIYAMAEDRLAPHALAWIHPRFHTPAPAILTLAAWTSILVLAVAVLTEADVLPQNKPHFDILTDFAMFGATTFETLAVLSIFIFRKTRPNAERPYRCPGYPFVPAIYVFILALVVINMFRSQLKEALIGLGFIGLGAVVYCLFTKPPKLDRQLEPFADQVDSTGPTHPTTDAKP